MEGEQVVGVEPASPAADPAVESSAGTLNTETPGQPPAQPPQSPEQQYVPYSRFAQLNQEKKQLAARLDKLESLQQKAQQQSGQLSPQDQLEYKAAADALRKVFASDPQLATLLKLSEQAPQIEQATQGVSRLMTAEERRQVQAGTAHIKGLTEKAGMQFKSPDAQQAVTRMVAQWAMKLPDGADRYEAGDYTVLDEAFKLVQEHVFGGVARQAGNQFLKTKQATQGLPPAPNRGGFAGQPATPKPVEGKEREYTANLHKRALALLEDRATAG